MEPDNVKALLSAGAAQAATDPLSVTEEPAILVPDGYELASLERYMAKPQRLRRRYRTHLVEDFVQYVNEAAAEASQQNQVSAVFINPDGDGAQAIIDAGSHDAPHWGDHTATLALRQTEEYKALRAACDQDLTQRALTDYIEDWHDILTLHKGSDDKRKEIRAAHAVAAIRKVQIDANGQVTTEEGDFHARRSAMESVEAKSDEKRPDTITLHAPLFEGTEEREITARLSLLTGSSEPRFRMRIMALGRLQRTVRDEVTQAVREGIGDDARVYVGQV